jgi:hypothetical protein
MLELVAIKVRVLSIRQSRNAQALTMFLWTISLTPASPPLSGTPEPLADLETNLRHWVRFEGCGTKYEALALILAEAERLYGLGAFWSDASTVPSWWARARMMAMRQLRSLVGFFFGDLYR